MFRNLHNLMHQKRITLEALAKILGVSEKTVYNKIRGKTEFTLSEVQIISRCLFPEYTIDYLFTQQQTS